VNKRRLDVLDGFRSAIPENSPQRPAHCSSTLRIRSAS